MIYSTGSAIVLGKYSRRWKIHYELTIKKILKFPGWAEQAVDCSSQFGIFTILYWMSKTFAQSYLRFNAKIIMFQLFVIYFTRDTHQ